MSLQNMSTIVYDEAEVRFERKFHRQEEIQTYYIKMQTDEHDGFIVTCPDLQGVVTSGKTESEAIKNAYDAVQTMLEARSIDNKFQLLVL